MDYLLKQLIAKINFMWHFINLYKNNRKYCKIYAVKEYSIMTYKQTQIKKPVQKRKHFEFINYLRVNLLNQFIKAEFDFMPKLGTKINIT